MSWLGSIVSGTIFAFLVLALAPAVAKWFDPSRKS